ncbi:MAG: signal peptidase I [Deltaproteobacteria bacterium]|nr:MAG: signal peptidase I [Deltaproteobacteria bacterium]TMB31175.1 MAG: signal peptidase I [Deltaproteobacteria bacterium]
MTAAAETRSAAQAKREAELVSAADRGPRAFYGAAGYGKLAGILGGTVAIALVAQHLLRRQEFLLGSLCVFLAIFLLSTIGSATPWGVRNRARNEARSLRRSASRLLRRNRGKIPESAAAEVEKAILTVEEALVRPQGMPAVQARHALDAALDQHLAFARKGAVREYTESIGGAILVALLLRAFVFEPFHIPSGSMIPTLLVGDFIFVNKMSYGLRIPFTDPGRVHKLWERPPKRGDVVVFINPQHPDVDYVKRVVGLPGDHIDIRENVLYVNGVEQKRVEVGDYTYKDHSEYTDTDIDVVARMYIENLDGHQHPILVRKDPVFQRAGSFVVEEGRVFMMGDNRDNSADSRVEGGIGQIPFSYIKGRASVIWISFGGKVGIRLERMFRGVR